MESLQEKKVLAGLVIHRYSQLYNYSFKKYYAIDNTIVTYPRLKMHKHQVEWRKAHLSSPKKQLI